MDHGRLEHANITVTDPKATAEELSRLFGWHIRWEGEAISGGYSVHVGNETSYLAVYAPPGDRREKAGDSYHTLGGLNHVGIVVDDLDGTETRVREAGYHPRSHADYEPGKRFYFDFRDGIEIEVVSYG